MAESFFLEMQCITFFTFRHKKCRLKEETLFYNNYHWWQYNSFSDNYLTKQLKLIRCWHDNQTKVLIYTPFSFTVWREIKNIEEKSFQSIELEKYVTTNNCPTRQGRFYYFIHLSVVWILWVIFYTFFYDEVDGHRYQKSMNSELF